MRRGRTFLMVSSLSVACVVVVMVIPWGVPPSLWGASRTGVSIGDQRLYVVRNPGNGMVGIDDLGALDGMLFEFEEPSRPGTGSGWHMLDVPIPLEAAFFDASGRLIEVQRMEPCSAEPCPVYDSAHPYKWVIETEVGVLSARQGAVLVVDDRPSH